MGSAKPPSAERLAKLRELVAQPVDQLLEARYRKFRRFGVFLEAGVSDAPPADDAPELSAGFRADLVSEGESVYAAALDGTVHVLDARSGRRTGLWSMRAADIDGNVHAAALARDLFIAVTEVDE